MYKYRFEVFLVFFVVAYLLFLGYMVLNREETIHSWIVSNGYTITENWGGNTLIISGQGVVVEINPTTLEEKSWEEIPYRLPKSTPVTPEEFSAIAIEAIATYQVSADQISRATTLFNLASQGVEVKFITTMDDGFLWGALIPID